MCPIVLTVSRTGTHPEEHPMATTTEIADIADMLYLGDYVGEFVDDYDMDAVHRDLIDAIQARLPQEATVISSGMVYAECDMDRNLAGDWSGVPRNEWDGIDWAAIIRSVDIDTILERHDRTAQA
jgi:hypothetical protein